MTSSPKTDLARLRDFVANVPEPTCFQESVRQLTEVFDYERWVHGISWALLRKGCDTAFFGERTLRALDPGFPDTLHDHQDFDDEPREYIAGVTSDLRMELQQFAVVGRRFAWGKEQAVCLVLHGDQPFPFGSIERPDDARLAAMELFRLRAGLMNRRQAVLLANHLNRFRNNGRHRERLTWSVVRGPGPEMNARRWADGVLGRPSLLRASFGETDSWGLGDEATSKLSTFAVQVRYGVVEQVFSYGIPQVVLPPRYEVLATFKERQYGMPEKTSITVQRQHACVATMAVARPAEQAGLIRGMDGLVEPRLEEFWGVNEYERGDAGYSEPPADVYACSFSRIEAIAVMRALRQHGFWNLRARRVGVEGVYVRRESGNSYFSADEVRRRAELEVQLGDEVLEVVLSTWYTLSSKHTPFDQREAWEEEALLVREQEMASALAAT